MEINRRALPKAFKAEKKNRRACKKYGNFFQWASSNQAKEYFTENRPCGIETGGESDAELSGAEPFWFLDTEHETEE